MKRLLLFALLAVPVLAQQNGVPQPCWGSDERCPDGKYRGRDGQEQPDSCANMGTEHPCACARTEEPEHCSPERQAEGQKCQVYCRHSDCHCTNSCDD